MSEENPARGLFITVEGMDGAGKTTQARMLAWWLSERGHEVVLTREPGGTALGAALRKLLLDGGARVGAEAELMLYAADRAQHVEEVVRPALGEGRTVVCERYADSTTVYQGCGRRLDLEFVERLNRFVTGGMEPDLTLLLDVDPQAARQRLAEIPDRLEREQPEFHERVAAGYRALARRYRERIRIIDANAAPDQAFRQVARVMEDFLRAPRRLAKGGGQ